MIKAKWLSIIVCACLLLSPQSNISANLSPAQTEPPHEFDRLRQMITGDPAQFYAPSGESAPASDPAPQPDAITFPAWSKVAFQTYRNNQWDIYLANPDGSNEVRLTDSAARDVYPSLAKGGKQLVFASDRQGSYDIFVRDINSGEEKFIYNSPATDTYPVWSPDATRIAFQSNLSGNYEIYVMNPDGSNLVQLTNSASYDGEPTWSPDGSQFAFVSNRSGRNEIWVMNADGSNLRQLTSYSDTATPAWSPRGDLIAYANDRNMDGYYELWWMDADGSNSVSIKSYGSSEQSDDWAPAWSPDGNFFSFIHTEWPYGPSYGWVASYTQQYDPYNKAFGNTQGQDRRVMRHTWSSMDHTAPIGCEVSLAPYQNTTSFLVKWSAVDAESGPAWYNVQSRHLPDGTWQDFFKETNLPGGVFSGVQGAQIEFRCQAKDLSGNLGDWSAPPFAATEIRSLRPTSTIVAGQRYVRGSQTVNLLWAGRGNPGLTLRYDIFVLDGTSGVWQLWLQGVETTSAQFNGTPGHTYYFRSQARDSAGHIQVWRPEPQATVTFYPASLSAPTISLSPAALIDESGTPQVSLNDIPSVVLSLNTYIPLVHSIQGTVNVPEAVPASDWLTLKKDNQRSGFAANDPGASRYALAWKAAPFGYYGYEPSQVVSADGVIIIWGSNGSQSGIFAYDVSSGQPLWEHWTPDSSTVSQVTIANGKAYFYASGANVPSGFMCVDLYSGNLIWRAPSSYFFTFGSPQIFDQNIYVNEYRQTTEKITIILNAASGEKTGRLDAYANPMLEIGSYASGKLYTWNNGIFSELDPDTGKLIWNLAVAWNEPYSSSMPLIQGRTAIVTSDSSLNAIDLDTHTLRWTVKGTYGRAFPAASEDSVYVINDNVLEVRRLSNGALINSFTAGAPLSNGPVVAGNHVYVSGTDFTYILDRTTLQIESNITEGGALSLANGYLFIARSMSRVSIYRAQER